jgi:UDP-N-acetylglucosamine--N-acetylmuramyl-(pentapeptide) pyrophosphoryl-undecaprenol N-acetylglucosamine transferase
MFARFSKMMFLGFPEAETHLSHKGGTQFIDSGNPIEPPPNPLPNRAAARKQWGFPERGGVVMLIYGGSQGSEAINKVVDNWIARGLPEGLHIIWATGPKNIDRYRKRDSERVKVRGYLDPIRDSYAASDIALARAGAMTTSELCAWGIPMVLVPLPNSAGDHQSDNAKALTSAGAAVNLPQVKLDVASLDGTVRQLVADPAVLSALADGARARGRPFAADMIAEQILSLARGGAIFRAPNATTR